MSGGLCLKPVDLYHDLLIAFGPQDWWPAEDKFEVAVGALLTQQTSWKNVEKAIGELKHRGLMTPEGLSNARLAAIELCIRPTGYYRQKAKRLQNLANEFPGMESRRNEELLGLRAALLQLDGVGKETADSILLYAFERPILPVDAYTFRITERIFGFVGAYEAVREFYETRLPKDAQVLNEFHALLVELAKRHCNKRKSDCGGCPVKKRCRFTKKERDRGRKDVSQATNRGKKG